MITQMNSQQPCLEESKLHKNSSSSEGETNAQTKRRKTNKPKNKRKTLNKLGLRHHLDAQH